MPHPRRRHAPPTIQPVAWRWRREDDAGGWTKWHLVEGPPFQGVGEYTIDGLRYQIEELVPRPKPAARRRVPVRIHGDGRVWRGSLRESHEDTPVPGETP